MQLAPAPANLIQTCVSRWGNTCIFGLQIPGDTWQLPCSISWREKWTRIQKKKWKGHGQFYYHRSSIIQFQCPILWLMFHLSPAVFTLNICTGLLCCWSVHMLQGWGASSCERGWQGDGIAVLVTPSEWESQTRWLKGGTPVDSRGWEWGTALAFTC